MRTHVCMHVCYCPQRKGAEKLIKATPMSSPEADREQCEVSQRGS